MANAGQLMQLQTKAAYAPKAQPSDVESKKQTESGCNPTIDNLASSKAQSKERSKSKDSTRQSLTMSIDEADEMRMSLDSVNEAQEADPILDNIPQ